MVLCGGFIAGAGAGHVHALAEDNAFLGCNLFCQTDKCRVIRTGHVRETGAKVLQVGSDKRIRQEVDVIPDYHEVSHAEAQVGAAGCVGNKQVLDANHLHHADRERDLGHVISLIVVDTALHGNNGFAAEGAHNEAALVADCS